MGNVVIAIVCVGIVGGLWLSSQMKLGRSKASFRIHTTDQGVERELSVLEHWYCAEHDTGYAGVFSVAIDLQSSGGLGLDEARLLRAIRALGLLNPYLRAFLVNKTSAAGQPSRATHIRFLNDLPHDYSDLIFAEVDLAPDEAMHDLMLKRFGLETYLWRCHLITLPDGHYRIVVMLHHLVADATGGIAIAQNLLQLYSEDYSTIDSPPTLLKLPQTLEELVDIRPTLSFAVSMMLQSFKSKRAPQYQSPPYFCGDRALIPRNPLLRERKARLTTFSLSETISAQVMRTAKTAETTVNAVLLGLASMAIDLAFKESSAIKLGVPEIGRAHV